MFENFTFGAQAQTSHIQQEETSASPIDCSFRLEKETQAPTSNHDARAGGISDIVSKLSSQSLCPDTSDDERSQPSIWNNTLPTPDFVDHDMIERVFTPEEMTYMSANRGRITLPTHGQSLPNLPLISQPRYGYGTVACRRLQRQLNVQLQSCSAHIRDISALVEDMIENSSQCHLLTSTSTPRPSPYHHSHVPQTSSPTPFHTEPLVVDTDDFEVRVPLPDEDEGFAEMEDSLEDEMTLRRASTLSGIRKYNILRYRASGELVGRCGSGLGDLPGRRKVMRVPRMRRRKPKTVPE